MNRRTTDKNFVKEKQAILKSMPDTICLTRKDAEIMAAALEELLRYQELGSVDTIKELVKQNTREDMDKEI